jgi:hypothetical protein
LFRINSAEAKPVLSQAEGNLVLCIEKRLFAKNGILRRFPFAYAAIVALCSGLRLTPQNDILSGQFAAFARVAEPLKRIRALETRMTRRAKDTKREFRGFRVLS